MNNCKISVIIPTFNAAKTLEAAILSVIEQTYENIELVIVDGASVDGTLAIIEKYKSKISVQISEPDKGVYDAMNKGIKAASGEWIYFLGSDDLLYNEHVLSDIFETAAITDFDVIYGNVFLRNRKILHDGLFDLQKLTFRNICHQSLFIKKKVFEIVGNYSLNYKTLADYEHNIRWFTNEKINKKFVELIVANYAESGLSSNFIDEKFLLRKPGIFKNATKKKLDFSNHYHIIGAIGTAYVSKHKFLKGYFFSLIAVFRIRDFQYLKKSLKYTKEYLKNKLNRDDT